MQYVAFHGKTHNDQISILSHMIDQRTIGDRSVSDHDRYMPSINSWEDNLIDHSQWLSDHCFAKIDHDRSWSIMISAAEVKGVLIAYLISPIHSKSKQDWVWECLFLLTFLTNIIMCLSNVLLGDLRNLLWSFLIVPDRSWSLHIRHWSIKFWHDRYISLILI